MIKTIILLALINVVAWGQTDPNGINTAIFQGGVADGSEKINFAQAANNIMVGGNGVGNTLAAFTQTANNIFMGNTGDGSANTIYMQVTNPIFAGGNADGWSATNFTQAGNSVYEGGTGDGWNAMYYKPTVALPVVYVYFHAKKSSGFALLTWETSSETNAAYYEIQRGTDALKFETIGKITAYGQSIELNQYQYLDQKPLKGINYYRLKQVDLDGKYSYTPARALNFSELNAATAKYYPNPTHGQLTIELSENLQKEAKIINIFNTLGIVVGHQKVSEFSENKLKLEMAGLPKGVYIIQVISKSLNSTQRIILN